MGFFGIGKKKWEEQAKAAQAEAESQVDDIKSALPSSDAAPSDRSLAERVNEQQRWENSLRRFVQAESTRMQDEEQKSPDASALNLDGIKPTQTEKSSEAEPQKAAQQSGSAASVPQNVADTNDQEDEQDRRVREALEAFNDAQYSESQDEEPIRTENMKSAVSSDGASREPSAYEKLHAVRSGQVSPASAKNLEDVNEPQTLEASADTQQDASVKDLKATQVSSSDAETRTEDTAQQKTQAAGKTTEQTAADGVLVEETSQSVSAEAGNTANVEKTESTEKTQDQDAAQQDKIQGASSENGSSAKDSSTQKSSGIGAEDETAQDTADSAVKSGAAAESSAQGSSAPSPEKAEILAETVTLGESADDPRDAELLTPDNPLHDLVAAMRGYGTGKLSYELRQLGDDMHYRIFHRGLEVEQGIVVPTDVWFPSIATLYVRSKDAGRVWDRALVVASPELNGLVAVQASYTNTHDASSTTTNYIFDAPEGASEDSTSAESSSQHEAQAKDSVETSSTQESAEKVESSETAETEAKSLAADADREDTATSSSASEAAESEGHPLKESADSSKADDGASERQNKAQDQDKTQGKTPSESGKPAAEEPAKSSGAVTAATVAAGAAAVGTASVVSRETSQDKTSEKAQDADSSTAASARDLTQEDSESAASEVTDAQDSTKSADKGEKNGSEQEAELKHQVEQAYDMQDTEKQLTSGSEEPLAELTGASSAVPGQHELSAHSPVAELEPTSDETSAESQYEYDYDADPQNVTGRHGGTDQQGTDQVQDSSDQKESAASDLTEPKAAEAKASEKSSDADKDSAVKSSAAHTQSFAVIPEQDVQSARAAKSESASEDDELNSMQAALAAIMASSEAKQAGTPAASATDEGLKTASSSSVADTTSAKAADEDQDSSELPEHVDDSAFISEDEKQGADTVSASAANQQDQQKEAEDEDLPAASSDPDVPTHQAASSVLASDALAEGNLVLTDAEVIKHLAPVTEALFGQNGSAQDATTVLIRVRSVGSYYDVLTHVRRNGFWEQVRTFELLSEDDLSVPTLKANSYREGDGSPLAMSLTFTPGVPVQSAFDYSNEQAFVRYPRQLDAERYVEELRMFPRLGANIPEHMASALTHWNL